MRRLLVRRAGNHRMRPRDVRRGRPRRISRAGQDGGLPRLGAGASAGALAALHAAATGAATARLGDSTTTGLLLATAVVSGRHGVSPRDVQRAPLPAVSTADASEARALHPPAAAGRPGHRPAPGPAEVRRRVEHLGLIGKPRPHVAGEREDREEEDGGTEGHAHRPPQTQQRRRPYAGGWSRGATTNDGRSPWRTSGRPGERVADGNCADDSTPARLQRRRAGQDSMRHCSGVRWLTPFR